ncbi:MAG: NADPH:quinone reductase [Alphaproteobacteria bacterium]|nr:NADPH:quinone reductase [Alphaproteobacteria bacterium]
MRAAWYEACGPARDVLQLGEMPTPSAGPGEVRVRLHASGINPYDVKVREGLRQKMAFPRIVPHCDGAGEIDAIGDGVPEARLGERVWVFNAQWQRAQGTAAEWIVLPQALAVPLPENTSFMEGACLGIPAMTAHRAVFSDGLVTGSTILVTGGAGGVGFYAIQLAKWGGARVIATISSDAKAKIATAAGADHVINYRTENVVERLAALTDGWGADRIVDVDFGANLKTSGRVLKENGVIATYASMGDPEPKLPFYPLMFGNVNLRLVAVFAIPYGARLKAIADITRCCQEGILKHRTKGFPLDRIVEAQEAVESGQEVDRVILEIA